MDTRRRIAEVVRYGSVGAVGLAINLALLTALVEIGDVRAIPAAVVAATGALAVTYVATDRMVFGDVVSSTDAGPRVGRAATYYAVMVGGKLLNLGIYAALVAIDVWYPAAWVVGSGLVFLATYAANRSVWRRCAPE